MSKLLGVNADSGSLFSSTGNTIYDISYNYGIFVTSGNSTGTYIPGDFYLKTYIGNANATNEISMTNSSKIQYIDPLLEEMVKGVFNMNIDLDSLLTFSANLTTTGNISILSGTLENAWLSPFKINFLQIPVLNLKLKIQTLEVIDQ